MVGWHQRHMMDMNLSKLCEMVKNRKARRAAPVAAWGRRI